jgi:phage-related protein
MAEETPIICIGRCYSILWGLAASDQCQARDYYRSLDLTDRAKAMALFKRMADIGKIYDLRKFNRETKKLYVFKQQPHRFFCFFAREMRIYIISAYRKQSSKAPPREIARAERLRLECLERISREEHRNEKHSK